MIEFFCFVVERTEWEENLKTGEVWEDRHVVHVFKSYEDAKAYVEKNAANIGYPCRWRGDKLYTGRTVYDGESEEGVRYEIHYVPIS